MCSPVIHRVFILARQSGPSSQRAWYMTVSSLTRGRAAALTLVVLSFCSVQSNGSHRRRHRTDLGAGRLLDLRRVVGDHGHRRVRQRQYRHPQRHRPHPRRREGRHRGAELSGSSGKVTVANAATLNLTSSYTIAAWVKPATTTASYQTA